MSVLKELLWNIGLSAVVVARMLAFGFVSVMAFTIPALIVFEILK